VAWTRATSAVELFRGRLALLGPVTPRQLGEPLGFDAPEAETVLLDLESEGVALGGWFSPGGTTEEWCDRRLLARIHRATLQRLRAEIQPISPADFMRFLFEWQHLTPSSRVSGVEGLRTIVAQLDGFELAAGAWDKHVLPGRVSGYDTSTLDLLCYSGEAAWARLTQPPAPSPPALLPPRPVRATPVALFLRDHARQWRVLANIDRSAVAVSDLGAAVLRVLDRGAQFVQGIADAAAMPVHDVREALSELVWAGLVASDGFAGLRAMWSGPPSPPRGLRGYGATAGPPSPPRGLRGYGATAGGRWSRLDPEPPAGPAGDREGAIELYAQVLLQRYGIMCRRLLAREPYAVPWRELLRVYRRLEARGDIRGGRFVSGLAGEQFALPEAVVVARQVRRTKTSGDTVTISAADPLNLCGIITAGDRVPAVASAVITFRDGVPRPSADQELTSAAHSA
jgi:ATP-dependent Lhr-like helicase